jgi:apolipoprotein N-acyltransferase
VIDPVGRVIKQLPLATEGVLDAPLPRALGPTPYVRLGDAPAWLLLGAAAILVIRRRAHR